MASGTVQSRIDRLERERQALRMQIPLLAPGSTHARLEIINLVDYISSAIGTLRRRQAGIVSRLSTVSKRSQIRKAEAVAILHRPAAPRPAWPLAASYTTVREHDELVTSWTPHRNAPSLIGAYPRKDAR